jgi:hydrogenase maturation protein HypF
VKDFWPACVSALKEGKILALKGVGGFQLAVDARNEKAVAALRERKHRPHKPFALMVKDLEAARRICELSEGEEQVLRGLERPILLLRARSENGIAASVASGAPFLGVMLPSNPLHEILFEEIPFPLVMTSGNREGDPIEKEEEEARRNLAGMADLFLSHNRPIRSFCDDSVARLDRERPVLLRRARGYAPSPIKGIFSSRPLLAVGPQLKNTFCLVEGNQYVLSQHLGNLDSLKVYEAFEAEILRFERLFSLRPEAVAHDLHPDYRSTLWAEAFAKRRGLPLFPVQHHHAHMASCMLENGLEGDCLGVVFDGSGYGEDGALWGGEFLSGDYRSVVRKGRIRPLPLLGGAQAMREPWRMALAWLEDANIRWEGTRDFPPKESELLRRARGSSAFTSSAGRLFDAVPFLLTGRNKISYEGQAAIELEWLAARGQGGEILPYKIDRGSVLEIDSRPMAVALWERRKRQSAAVLALSFHLTLARALTDICEILREETNLSRVVLSGGVFANGLLSRLARAELESKEFEVYCHATVPPNDGGISLGQAAVAVARGGES